MSETTLSAKTQGGRWTVRLTHVLQGGSNVSLPSVQQDCGGSGGHGSAPGGALTPRWVWALRGGRVAVPLTPRGRPSRGTAGTNPKTGGHQPKDWQALPFNTVGDREFFPDFGECVSEVVRGSSILVWVLGMSV